VVEATGSRTPLNFLRNVLQHRASWTLLFSGSHEPKELPDYWSDYLINTRTLRVSYLDEDSARELIVQPVEDFTDIYDRTAIDTIIHLTRCQPYLIQLTCQEVMHSLNAGGTRLIQSWLPPLGSGGLLALAKRFAIAKRCCKQIANYRHEVQGVNHD
jgi:AAA+ ATPase superfamily predicted ATPase